MTRFSVDIWSDCWYLHELQQLELDRWQRHHQKRPALVLHIRRLSEFLFESSEFRRLCSVWGMDISNSEAVRYDGFTLWNRDGQRHLQHIIGNGR
ncbi:hypothetical protein OSTOST_09815 [Ostertagia ostertagi]